MKKKAVSLHLPLITNINKIISPFKRHRVAERMKNNTPKNILPTRLSTFKDIYRLKVNR